MDGHQSQFITLTIDICVQRVEHTAPRHADLSAAAETCSVKAVHRSMQ